MSTIEVNKITPVDGGTATTLGDSGDTFTVPTGAGLTVTDEVKTNKISPASGTTFTLGDSGETFNIPSGATIANAGTANGFGEDNAPYFLTTGSGSQSVASGTMVTVAYDTLVDSLDSASGFNTSTYRYTIQSGGAGFWSFTAAVYFTGIADGTQFDINFYKNGGNKSQFRQKSGGSMNATMQVTQLIKMDVGDYGEIKVYQNTGSTQGVNVNDASSFFGGFRIKAL